MTPKKRSVCVALNNAKEAGVLGSKRPILEKRKPKEYLVLPLFPCSAKKAATLLEQCVRDQVICLSYMD